MFLHDHYIIQYVNNEHPHSYRQMIGFMVSMFPRKSPLTRIEAPLQAAGLKMKRSVTGRGRPCEMVWQAHTWTRLVRAEK